MLVFTDVLIIEDQNLIKYVSFFVFVVLNQKGCALMTKLWIIFSKESSSILKLSVLTGTTLYSY